MAQIFSTQQITRAWNNRGYRKTHEFFQKAADIRLAFEKIPTKRRGIHVNLKIKYRKRENSRKKGENLREDTRLPAKWRPRERERESACVEQCRGSFRPRSSRFIENQYGRHGVIEDVINFWTKRMGRTIIIEERVGDHISSLYGSYKCQIGLVIGQVSSFLVSLQSSVWWLHRRPIRSTEKGKEITLLLSCENILRY